MPGRIAPHASGAHRLACFSLYRALLKECSIVEVAKDAQTERSRGASILTNLVRFRFSRDQSIQSPSEIANGLKTGYAALDLINACNKNDVSAIRRLKSLLESTVLKSEYQSAYQTALASARSPTSLHKQEKIAHIKACTTKSRNRRYPRSKPILERPLPLSEIRSGKRRVPDLLAAQGVPFLRYSKPQPVGLSRVLRQRLQRHQKWWMQKEELEADQTIAEWEDNWDDLVKAQVGDERTWGNHPAASRQEPSVPDGLEGPEESWRHEAQIAEGELMQMIRTDDWNNAEMGRKMWAIVVKERELALQEARDAKAQRRVQKKASLAAGQVRAVTSDMPDEAHKDRKDVL